MGTADDRRQMVFAMRFEADVAQHDQLVVAVDLLEGAFEEGDGIGLVAAKELFIGARHPVGRPEQTFTFRIVPGPTQQCAHGLLGFGAAGLRAYGLSGGAGFERQAVRLPHEAVLSWPGVAGRGEAPSTSGQLSWLGWCGLSSEKAGTATSKRSPPSVSIW